MKIFEKKNYLDGKRELYLCNIKIFSYIKWKKYRLDSGIIDYNTLPYNNIEKQHVTYPKISIIYPVYYTNNDFSRFNNLINKYNQMSDEIKSKFELIFVDDGSTYPVKLPKCNLNISLLKVNKDIPWNNSGARNLGACYAITPRLVMMDAEFYLPENSIATCIDIKLSDNDILPLSLSKSEKEEPYSVHPNLFCMNKRTFFNFNCYDESWCGSYGEDLFYRKYIMHKGINIIKPKIIVLLETQGKKNTDSHSLSRNLDKTKKRLAHMPTPEHKKEILKFPWEFVEAYKYQSSETL